MRAIRVGAMAMGLALGALGAWSLETAWAQDGASRDDAEALIRQLAAPEFEAREAAEKRLVALGAAAVPALERAAEQGGPEVRRRARRALARIRDRQDPQAHPPIDPFAPPPGWERVRPPRPGAPPRAGDPFEDFWRNAFGGKDPFAGMDELFDELLRDLGEPAPPRRHRVPDPGRVPSPLDSLDRMLDELLKGGGPFGVRPLAPDEQQQLEQELKRARERMRQLFGGPDADLEQWLEQQRKEFDERVRRMFGGQDPFGNMPDLDELMKRLRQRGQGLPAPRAGGGTSRSFSMNGDGSVRVVLSEGPTRITVEKQPDGGIRVVAEEPDASGAVQRREWSAASEAELRAEHPDGAKAYDRAMGGIRINPGRGLRFGQGAPGQPGRPAPGRTRGLTTKRSEALGCSGDSLGNALRTQLEVPEGQGVYLSRVEPGGWAAGAGLRAHDVVLTVAGHDVATLDAMAKQVAATEGEFELEIVRFGSRQTLTAKGK